MSGIKFNLVFSVVLLIIPCLFADESDAPSERLENPVLREYRLLSMMRPSSDYAFPLNRKYSRSPSFKVRNCFFSPVQCHLNRPGFNTAPMLQRRRRIFERSDLLSYDNYVPIFRIARK